MSYAHEIDNDNSIFDFDDSNEPLCPLDLEESAPERRETHISTSHRPCFPLSCTLMERNPHTVGSADAAAKGKSVASTSSERSRAMSIPIVPHVHVDPDTDLFSMSLPSAGSSSQRYEHMPPFDFQGVEAITYLDPNVVNETPPDDEQSEPPANKGKSRELPPTLPPLSFLDSEFSDSNVQWPSVAGPSSFGSAHTAASAEEYSPLSPSSVVLNVPMSSPISSDI